MCWSASADLAAGTVIVALGALGVALARHKRDLPLAALPLVFGVHQLLESRIYHESYGQGDVLTGGLVTAWTFIAFALLPAYAPLALLLAERQRTRPQWGCAACGIPVAIVMLFVVFGGSTHALDRGTVMDYGGGIPLLPLILGLYLVATILPFVLSPERTMRELGIGLVVGAIAAGLIDTVGFASIWCAFAAVVSVLIVRRTRHASENLAPASF